jgi:hypothetical protein
MALAVAAMQGLRVKSFPVISKVNVRLTRWLRWSHLFIETIMANTFSNIYLQFVSTVQKRKSLISKKHKEELLSKFEIPYDGKYLFRFFD